MIYCCTSRYKYLSIILAMFLLVVSCTSMGITDLKPNEVLYRYEKRIEGNVIGHWQLGGSFSPIIQTDSCIYICNDPTASSYYRKITPSGSIVGCDFDHINDQDKNEDYLMVCTLTEHNTKQTLDLYKISLSESESNPILLYSEIIESRFNKLIGLFCRDNKYYICTRGIESNTLNIFDVLSHRVNTYTQGRQFIVDRFFDEKVNFVKSNGCDLDLLVCDNLCLKAFIITNDGLLLKCSYKLDYSFDINSVKLSLSRRDQGSFGIFSIYDSSNVYSFCMNNNNIILLNHAYVDSIDSSIASSLYSSKNQLLYINFQIPNYYAPKEVLFSRDNFKIIKLFDGKFDLITEEISQYNLNHVFYIGKYVKNKYYVYAVNINDIDNIYVYELPERIESISLSTNITFYSHNKSYKRH